VTASPNYTYILFEASALTLTYIKHSPEAFGSVENQLTPVLNMIMEQNVTDLLGYAFQIYATFVACAATLKVNYEMLANSILEPSAANWSKEMKYLIPAEALFLLTVICKFPEFASKHLEAIQKIVGNLLQPSIRQEQEALKISSAVYEKIGASFDTNGSFLQSVLMGIFTCLHFYRNNTKSKVIPTSIMRSVHTFFANFMVVHGTQALVQACDKIQ
jgi:hypothetical protein